MQKKLIALALIFAVAPCWAKRQKNDDSDYNDPLPVLGVAEGAVNTVAGVFTPGSGRFSSGVPEVATVGVVRRKVCCNNQKTCKKCKRCDNCGAKNE